jgi:hypothetical protein
MSFTCVKNKGICDGCMECRWNEDNIETEETLRCDFCGCEIKDSNEDSVMSGSHVWCVECWDEKVARALAKRADCVNIS